MRSWRWSRRAGHVLGQRPSWLPSVRLLEVWTATVVTAALVVGTVTAPRPAAVLPTVLLSAVGTASAHRWPWAGLLSVTGAPVLAATVGQDPLVLWSVAVFVAFALALRGVPAPVVAVVAGGANLAAEHLFRGTVSLSGNPTASVAAFAAVLAAAAGSAVRGQHQYWSALQQLARDAVVNREDVVRRSVAEERVRIARDLHDSVGHHMAVVSMHLGVAQVSLASQDTLRSHLAAARSGVQDVLAEVQQILQVLRVGQDGAGAELTPTPGAEHLGALVESFRSAGVEVQVDLAEVPDLAPHVSSAVYRIVQESLTNAQKHGSGAVRVRTRVRDAAVAVEVVNVKAAPDRATRQPRPAGGAWDGARGGGGRGLVGMRERAASAGGTVEVQEDGTVFRVRAELPTTGTRR